MRPRLSIKKIFDFNLKIMNIIKSSNHNKFKLKILTVIWVILIILTYFYFNPIIRTKYSFDITEKDLKSLNFWWQNILIDDNNLSDIKQRFEKELLITAKIDYQIQIVLKRTTLYFPYIEKKLKENWLPNDIKYIAFAESYLKNDAFSSAWAWWIWQFIPSTARQYWMYINDYVDERLNYEKATIWAIKYLKTINEKFNWDWFLSMAWYNMWQNWLQNEINNQWTNNFFELLLNEETSRYVFRVLAAKYVYENQENLWIYIPKKDFYYFPKYEEIEIDKITDLKEFAKSKWVSLYSIINLNTWIKYEKNILPQREDWENRKIKIPK